ncbi:uncharacterized protein TNCV_3249081 [Trichonephila clavipes]|nr:uncharacterized protein TNCV_3249081 [Trichonephila clavipes]
MARIIELIPGRDGKIRTVKLKTQHGTVRRPVQRVYPSEIRANENCVTEEVAVPLWHGGTLNSRRATSPLVWLVEGEERWEAPGHSQGFVLLNCGGTEQNRTVICLVLKAKVNDRRKNSNL